MPWAFEDDFSTGLSNWVPARWRCEQYVASSDPAHVWEVGAGGPGMNFDGATSGVFPPNDVKVDGSGRLWLGAGSQNYGDTQVRCNQPFDFSSGTGVIQLDARLIACPVGLWGWSEVIVSDLPYTAVSMRSDNASGPVPQYGFMVRLNQGASGAYNATSGSAAPLVNVWNNFVETAQGGSNTTVSYTAMTTIVITFTHSNITITYGGVQVMNYDWTLPAGLTNGWLSLSAHNHATRKYSDLAGLPVDSVLSYNAVFDNVKFDGVVHDKCITYRVPDANVTHGSNARDIGYQAPTGSLTIPGVPDRVNSARLLASAFLDPAQTGVETMPIRYSLNGGANHDVLFNMPFGSKAGASLLSTVIDTDELVAGNNTIALSVPGNTSGYFPFFGNIGLLVLGLEPPAALMRVGTSLPKRMWMGATTSVLKAYQGSQLVWEPPILPFWTGSPATVTVTGNASTWAVVAPQTWTGSPATATVTGGNGTWSVPEPAHTWFDTTFVNINSGGNYQTVPTSAGDTWNTATAGQIHETYGFAIIRSRRLDAASVADQYVKLTVADLSQQYALWTHGPATLGTDNTGYYALWIGNGVHWYKDTTFSGNPTFAAQTGAGTIELRVEDHVATLYGNGVPLSSVDFSASPLTGRLYQGFGANGGAAIITEAEGGDYGEGAAPTPQTWPGSAATVTVTGNSSVWAIVAPQTWTRSAATIAVTGTSGTWALPAAGFTDNFNRANTTEGTGGLGANWTSGAGAYINANKAHMGGGGGFVVYNTNLGTPDHYVEATISGNYRPHYLVLDARSGATPGQNCYQFFVTGHNPLNVAMGKTVGGGFTEIANIAHGVDDTVPHTLRLEVEGTQQRGYIDGVLKLTTNDTSITTGNYTGLNGDGFGNDAAFDDFECGPL